MKPLLRFGPLILAIAMLASIACSGGGDESPPADAQYLTVTVGDSLTFDPPMLNVEAGRPVVLTVRNVGTTDHDFYVEGMPVTNVKNAVKGGHGHTARGAVAGHPRTRGEVVIWFTPTKSGSYEFWCSVTGHRDAGMRGTITVG